MKASRFRTPAEREAIQARLIVLMNAGSTQGDAAEKIGVSRDLVTYYCKRLRAKGLIPRARTGRRPGDGWASKSSLSGSDGDHSKPGPLHVYEAKRRACLSCSDRFWSEWPGERVCKPCKQTLAWRTGA